MSTRAWTYKVVLGAVVTLMACGDGSGQATVRGKVTDGSGTQQQQRVGQTEKFGGSGTVSATSEVRISALQPGGELTTLAEAELAADGSYQAEVPPGQTHLIVQALSASGEVVAQAIVESSGEGGQTQTAPPMDSETSVEAAVLIEMAAQGVAVAQANAVDLRARISREMAEEVTANASASAEVSSQIRALAQATASAQQARIEWYSRNGITTTQQALFEAQLEAAAELNAALDAGGSGAAQAYARFFAAVDTAEEAEGVDDQTRAEGESNSSAAFRATLEVRLSSSASDGLVDASLRNAASLEARASAVAVEAILAAGGAASAVQTAAVEAGAQLRADVSAATTAGAAASAFASYQTNLSGQTSIEGSVLGDYLAVNGSTAITAQVAVDAAANASADLSAALDSVLALTLGLSGTVDFAAVADATCDSYASYRAAVQAQAAALSSFGTKASPAVEVLVIAHASYN